MKTKKLLIIALSVFLCIGFIVTPSFAWWVNGTLTRVDQWPTGVRIGFQRAQDGWTSSRMVESANEKSILAIALTAISLGAIVNININPISNMIDAITIE